MQSACARGQTTLAWQLAIVSDFVFVNDQGLFDCIYYAPDLTLVS